MLDDMAVRIFPPDTQREYIRAVKKLAAYLRRSPDTATAEELRSFQIHHKEAGTRPPTMNATVTELRFFFEATVDRPEFDPRTVIRTTLKPCTMPPLALARSRTG